MNERIKQLAIESGLISSLNAAPFRPDIEKFAELIITESIKACAISILDNQYGNREDCITVCSDIAAHFGLD